MDGIFTDDELKADQATATDTATDEEQQEAEQDRLDGRERDEHGRFKAKESVDDAVEEAVEGEDGKQKTVPQGALHAEREKRKGSDERAAKAEAELASLKESLSAIQKMREQVAGRKPEELPAADDPAAIEHLRGRLAEVEQGQTRISQHLDEQALSNAELQQLGGFMQQSEARYRTEKPDYDAAIDHVVQARARELSLYGLAPAQIQQTISEEATEIVRSAVAQGRDPAELGYQIALSRGYRPAEGEQKQDVNGQLREEATKSLAQRQIDAIANAQKQSKSLGSAGGGKAPIINIEAINALSAEEFDALYSTPEGKAAIDAL